MHMDCIFCKIANKEIPTDFLYEDERIAAFKDIRPSAPVHILVVPKEHIQSVDHLGDNHREVLSSLIYTARDLAEKQRLKGYKLVFNVGREGGQVIDHLHLHLLGGWGKGGGDHLPHPGMDK